MKKRFDNLIFHPMLFGLYPVLFLTSINLGEIPFKEAWRAIIVVFLSSTVLWLFLRVILRDNQKAALVTTFLLISFFTYGHLYNYFGQEEVFSGALHHHRYLIPFFAGMVLLGSWWVIKKARNLDAISQIFNIVGLILVIFPIFQIASFEFRSLSQKEAHQERSGIEVNLSSTASVKDTPDIYYIILDAYGREDVLLELYAYDNSVFLDEMRNRGFYVADCSMSNYEKTFLSLASSLNLNYLDTLGGDGLQEGSTGEPDLIKLRALNKDNVVRRYLEALGYKTVAFQSGAYWTGWEDADYFFAYDHAANGNFQSSLNEFEFLFIETTAGQLFLDILSKTDIDFGIAFDDEENTVVDSRERIKFNRVNYMLDMLETIPSTIESPKLVFTHIISPHGPYVFTADGEFIQNQKEINPGYLDQITFLNRRILKIVDEIIRTSEKPPIIIIQADHGPPRTEYTPLRLPILNTYYLPNGGDEMLYSSITPVNSFRLIFDYYFGTNYGFLDDISRIATEDDLFDFTVVPNVCERH